MTENNDLYLNKGLKLFNKTTLCFSAYYSFYVEMFMLIFPRNLLTWYFGEKKGTFYNTFFMLISKISCYDFT
jgi:hypothetical protein